MTENEDKTVEGREYDTPLILPGSINIEPQRYVAEKPYDLTRYEYSFLKRNFTGSFWCNIFSGATAGILISVVAKATTALLDMKNPELEAWEITAIIIGISVSLFFKLKYKSEDDRTKSELNEVINTHFQTSLPRRVHLTSQEGKDEA